MEEKNRVCKQCLLRESSQQDQKMIETYKNAIRKEDRVSEKIYEARLSLCRDCEKLNQGTCSACGCYVELRALAPKGKCPYGKWKEVDFLKNLTDYYNKFNEDKRLDSRHGQIEFRTSMAYIHRYLDRRIKETNKLKQNITILDIGAATGRYSIPLSEEGYSVIAVEPVKHNISRLRQRSRTVKAYQADGRSMKAIEDDSCDLTLIFGPMYHLKTKEDQLKALLEAKRVTAPGGYILISYVMNEYAVLIHGFRDKNIKQAVEKGEVTADFFCGPGANPLYHMMRVEQIRELREAAGLTEIQLISADGAANYMRRELNALSAEEFELFYQYHRATCERPDLIGAAGHTLDIVKV